VIIGHSFGGPADHDSRGARGSRPLRSPSSPAPFRGVLPLRSRHCGQPASPSATLANWNRAVPLSYEQFRYSLREPRFGEDEAKELYLGYSVPGPGEPLFPVQRPRT